MQIHSPTSGQLNLTEPPDAKVLKMVKRAEVTLELETDKEIDYSKQKPVEVRLS